MAPHATNYSEIQQDEIEVLRSIYMEDFTEGEARIGAWNKTLDRTFNIKLRASNGDEHGGLTLTISLPSTYPKTLPRLTIKFGPEVRQTSRNQAEEMLKSKPQTLLGSEMIHEIAGSLQDILDNTWRDPKETVPLDEERAAKEQAARVRVLQEEEQQRQKDLLAQEEEEQLLQELIIQRQTQATKHDVKTLPTSHNGDIDGTESPGVIKFDRQACVKDTNSKVITFTSVHGKVRYGLGPVCEVFTVQAISHSQGNTSIKEPPFLVLKECHFFSSSGNEPSMKRLVQNLESRLEFHMGLTPHQSLTKPLNFRIQKTLDGWSVSLLMELAERKSLRETLDFVDRLDINLVRALSIQLIEGLQHYHRHGYAHANVHLSNILLLRDREAERGDRKITVATLSDGGYERDLHILKRGASPNYFPIAWTAPEVVNANGFEEPAPATDIWDFGRCFLQMALGVGILSEYSLGPTPMIDELRLTPSLKALLSRIFYSNPKKRPSAWDLLHFEFFRNDDALFDGGQTRDPLSLEASAPSPSSYPALSRRESLPASLSSSRYAKDFVEDGRLGRGGFGEVFRARNKVDGQPYAIKKIKARSKAALDPVLSEVTVLSRLNHPNVVRYFASWIEDKVLIDDKGASTSSEDDYTSSITNTNTKHRPVLPASSRGLDFISSNNAQIVFADDGDNGQESSEEDEESSSDGDKEGSDMTSPRQDSDRTDADVRIQVSSHSDDAAPSGAQERSTWTILYIQMEYCKQETLRDLINSDLQADPTRVWRLFRQIVQGLAHIHGLSIVHRDLKPENVFIDSDGDVRIGDFGLARPGDYRTVASQAASTRFTQREIFGSFTKDVGTASYVAPEVRSAGNGKYNEKADIFSLGVILLEMNVPFSTSMERAETLAQLQKENHTLPAAFELPEKATQAKIFMSLVQYKPSQRPSSSELLDSGEIPVQAEDESRRMARRLLNDRSSHERTQFLASFFAKEEQAEASTETAPQDPMQAVKLLEDVNAMSRSSPNDLDLQAMVKERLTAIYHRHGAVERTDSPALFPYHSYHPSEDVVRFLNPTGKIMQLPYDLILPNAMLLARQVRPEPKTFIFDNVYRVNHLRGQPKIFGEANFDIVSGKGIDIVFREAEVLKVIDEIIDLISECVQAFPNLAAMQMCYHINHSRLLDAILQFCDIDTLRWPAVKQTVSKLHTGEWTWGKVRHELRGPSIAVAATALDELERFDFRDLWDTAIPRLRSILKDTVDLEPVFAHMHGVTTYLGRLNVRRKIYISPLSSYNEMFYRGNLLFQCLYDQKRRSVFAAGGRYDQLVRDHQPITSRKVHVHAVGFQLAWTGLCADMMTYLNKASKTKAKKRSLASLNAAWRTRRCDVLIESFDQGLLASVGVDLLQQLWASDIWAELAESNVGDAADSIYSKVQEPVEDHTWIILIKSEEFLRVRNTIRDDETELRSLELIGHMSARGQTILPLNLLFKAADAHHASLLTDNIETPFHCSQTNVRVASPVLGSFSASELPQRLNLHYTSPYKGYADSETSCRNEFRERDRNEERSSKAPMLRQSSQPESNMLSKDREVDIKVLTSQNKGKKVNPQYHRQEYLHSIADSPIVAIETKDDVFEGINDTRLSDPESWKKFIQSAAPGERQYLGQLQTMLKNMAKETSAGNTTAIIYNFRTKACISYNLGKALP